MLRLLSFLLLVYASAGARGGDWAGWPARAAVACDEDTELTTTCSDDCMQVLLCRYGDDGYDWEPYRTCEPGQACKGNKCVEEGASGCEKRHDDITCSDSGTYPHPHECRQSITCDTDNGGNEPGPSCDVGFMYSACTGKCDWRHDEAACHSAEIDCKSLGYGARAAVYSNRRIYFTCRVKADPDGPDVFYPHFARCPPGTSFDDTTRQCEDHGGPGCGVL